MEAGTVHTGGHDAEVDEARPVDGRRKDVNLGTGDSADQAIEVALFEEMRDEGPLADLNVLKDRATGSSTL